MNILIRITDRLNTWFTRFSKTIIAVVFITMSIAVFLQIILRAMGHSFIAMEDVASFGFFWLVFLGMAAAFHDRIHVRVEFFMRIMPAKICSFLNILSNLIVLAFLLLFIWSGILMTSNNFMQHAMQLRISMAYIYFMMPLAGIFAFFIVLNQFLRDPKGDGAAETETDNELEFKK